MGEGSNPLETPRRLQRQRSLDAAEPAEGRWSGSSRCGGYSRCEQRWRGTEVGAPAFPPSSVGGRAPRRGWGAPKAPLGRASLSGPFGSWPQEGPPSGDRRHLGGGRGRGLRVPGKGEGKISHHVCQAPGREGREGSGTPRPQVTRAEARTVRSGRLSQSRRAGEGTGIPSAHARHSPGSAGFAILSVQSSSAGMGPSGVCPAPGLPCPSRAGTVRRPECTQPGPSGTQNVRARARAASGAAANSA